MYKPKPKPVSPRWQLAETAHLNHDGPPTTDEIEKAHDQIRDYAVGRYKTFKMAFHKLDADKNGTVSKKEFLHLLKLSSLPIREKTMLTLAGMYDKNGNGKIEYKEFEAAFLQPNAFHAAAEEHGSGYVDHSLEMWRTGKAMGGGRGEHGSYSSGYRFDGKVDRIGETDTSVPTMEEVERAHDAIRHYANTRWKTFRKAFNDLDTDRSGKVTKLEFLRILMHSNLPIRENTMAVLADIYDTNNNNVIDFNEFSMALVKGDAIDVTKASMPVASDFRKGKHVFKPGFGVIYDDTPRKPRETHFFESGGGPEYQHVDQNLEMWRSGQAAGANRRYDGKVDAIGHGDNDPPPTKDEMERAHDQIRNYAMTRWDTFRKAFRNLDEDQSGSVTKMEFLRVLMMANLQIREKTVAALVEMYDKNKNGEIDYNEFCAQFMNKEDVH